MTFNNIVSYISIGAVLFGLTEKVDATNYMNAQTPELASEDLTQKVKQYSTDALNYDIMVELAQELKGSDKLVIPEGFSTVKPYSYIQNGIKEVILPNSLKTIDKQAFSGSPTLESITIPSNVSEIRSCAFQHCTELKTIKFLENSKLGVIEDAAFKFCEQLSSIAIPGSVYLIAAGAFQFCTNLASVTFGNGIEIIGDSAFFACNSLKSVVLPSSVSWIGESIFANCTNLTTVVVENGLNEISDRAFANCSNLESITLPNSIKSIAKTAFTGCEKCRFTVHSSRVEHILIENGINKDMIDKVDDIEDEITSQQEPIVQLVNTIEQETQPIEQAPVVYPTDNAPQQTIDQKKDSIEPQIDKAQHDTNIKYEDKKQKKGIVEHILIENGINKDMIDKVDDIEDEITSQQEPIVQLVNTIEQETQPIEQVPAVYPTDNAPQQTIDQKKDSIEPQIDKAQHDTNIKYEDKKQKKGIFERVSGWWKKRTKQTGKKK